MILAKLIVPVHHALIYLRDTAIDNAPDIDEQASSWATRTCVAVTCMPDVDGATEITIASTDETPTPEGRPLVDVVLPTPSRRLAIDTAEEDAFFWLRVNGASTRVRVWTDGSRNTTWLWIVLG